ncbi:MAG TPA: NADAR family protein [Verrucomicrobiae bacterium]|nr:NADAR family protein [Verrucomicrobiae bacterium]
MAGYFLVLAMTSLLCSCRSPQSAPPQDYPARWWTPVSKAEAPGWEILPQESKPGEVILSKRNELGLLSNFAPTPFVFHHRRYASLEGFWQAMKYPENPADVRATFPGVRWRCTRAEVGQMTGFNAKRAGDLANTNMTVMHIDWVTFEGHRMEYRPAQPGDHYRLIVAITWQKVLQNAEVRRVLLSTGKLVLEPDHYQEPNAPAAWRYYEILTDIRSRLQSGSGPRGQDQFSWRQAALK